MYGDDNDPDVSLLTVEDEEEQEEQRLQRKKEREAKSQRKRFAIKRTTTLEKANTGKELTFEEKLELTSTYSPYIIPPQMGIAQIYFDCTAIGHEQDDKKKNIKTCPYSMSTEKKRLTLFENYTKILNYGQTIPLFFHFRRFILGYYLIMLLFGLYPAVQLAATYVTYCQERRRTIWWDISIFYDYPLQFYYDNARDIANIFDNSYWVDVACNISVIIYSLYFHIEQSKYIQTLENKRQVSPADFSVMVGNVKKSDELSKVEEFIVAEVKKHKLPRPRIIKMNRAQADGQLYWIRNEIRKKDKEITRIKDYIAGIRSQLDDKMYKQGEKLIEQKKKARKKLVKQRDAWEKKMENIRPENEDACLVFVTFATVMERDAVLSTVGKGRSWLVRLFKPDVGFKIMEAPFPDDIEWQNIGYSLRERTKLSIFGKFMVALTFPCFLTCIALLKANTISLKVGHDPSAKFLFIPYKRLEIMITSAIVVVFNIVFQKAFNFFHTYQKVISRNKLDTMTIPVLTITKIMSIVFTVLITVYMDGGVFLKMYVDFIGESYYMAYFVYALVPTLMLLNVCQLDFVIKNKMLRSKMEKPQNSDPLHFTVQRDLMNKIERPAMPMAKFYVDSMSILVQLSLMYYFTRMTVVYGIVNWISTGIAQKFSMMKKNKAPPPSALHMAVKMRRLVCSIVPRIFTLARIGLVYTQERIEHQLGRITVWLDILLLIFVMVPFESIFDYVLKLNQKTVVNPTMLLINFMRTSETFGGGGSGGRVGKTKLAALGLNDKFGKKKKKKKVNKKKQLSRKQMIASHFNKIEHLFTHDYDRCNPLTMKVAKKRWKKKKFNKLRNEYYESIGQTPPPLDDSSDEEVEVVGADNHVDEIINSSKREERASRIDLNGSKI